MAEAILNALKLKMETPMPYGWFHLLCCGIVIGLTVLLCTRYRNCSKEKIERAVLIVVAVVALLEIYKQIVYSFHTGDNGVYFDFQWYAFPWQFCSTPMYAGLLTGIFRKGKVHDALMAYLATFALFAGICVIVYPADVYIDLIGINIQTMVCHGSMIVMGVWLLASGYVKLEHRTIWKAAAVFAAAVGVAIALNEVTWYLDLTGGETFNMFFISRHWPGTLPVYSLVQQVVPYPLCMVIYICIFTFAAYMMLVMGMLIRRIACRRVNASSG